MPCFDHLFVIVYSALFWLCRKSRQISPFWFQSSFEEPAEIERSVFAHPAKSRIRWCRVLLRGEVLFAPGRICGIFASPLLCFSFFYFCCWTLDQLGVGSLRRIFIYRACDGTYNEPQSHFCENKKKAWIFNDLKKNLSIKKIFLIDQKIFYRSRKLFLLIIFR